MAGSLSNIKSTTNMGTGNISNIAGGNIQKKPENQPNFITGDVFKDTGTLLGNAKKNVDAITAGITTIIGGIIGYDKEGRQAIENIVGAVQGDREKQKGLADALLSTYNLTLDDIGNMPLGEMVGNVATGIWQHPIDAYMDFMSLKGLLIPKRPRVPSINADDLKLGQKINENDFLVKAGEEATKTNVKTATTGNEFVRELEKIEQKYSPKQISLGMQAIETVGFKNAPKELRAVMSDLARANNTYKQYVQMAGAELIDDTEFAARELLAKEHGVTFESTERLKGTRLYEDTLNYVRENNIQPLFHLKPKIHDLTDAGVDIGKAEKVESELFKRTFGTIDYDDAAKDLSKKATEFVDRVTQSTVADTPNRINKLIRDINKATGSKMRELDTGGLFNSRAWRELNSELKKVMLSSGIYLGANVVTTTLSILNNFDANAVLKTFKNMPKFRMVELSTAKTPILHIISKLNNKIYKPIASVDRWLENVATEYASHLGPEKIKLMQSAMPSKAVITNPVLKFVRDAIPFGQYPAAALQEVNAHLNYKPIKSGIYNQINKVGQEANVQAQEMLGLEPDKTKAVRLDEEGKSIERSIIVTPIQAANMFLFGTRGNAIQIPIIEFLNKLLKGEGDPTLFEVDGKRYRVNQGVITTDKGELNLLPALKYATKNLLSPVQFYNQVVVPLMSDKYIRNDTTVFNQLVSDSQYSNMSSAAKQRVTDKAREKLGKRLLGTYEYSRYENKSYISKSVRRKVMRKHSMRRSIDEALK